ncbi:MAG: restriction endonuclease subunit S [Polyangiaceae bacterium]|nr:restriction endonuclease subunit S [Polyangiaceae bacterium]
MAEREIRLAQVRRTTAEIAHQFRRSTLAAGDIVLSIVGTIGKVAFVPRELEGGNITQCSVRIRPDRSRVEPRFLAWALESPGLRMQYDALRFGSGVPRLNVGHVRMLTLPLPPVTEQRRIADILDKADAVRRKRRKAIALTEELLRSTFLEMFGDPVTNPKRWAVRPLGEVLSFLTSGSRGWASHYSTTGEMFLRIQNVGADFLDLSDVAFVNAPKTAEAKRAQVAAGDVLLSITADLGRTAVVPTGLPRAFINQHLAILRPNGVEPDYLSAFLASPAGCRQLGRLDRHGVKAGLNFDDIRSVSVTIPNVGAQRAFAYAKARIREHGCSSHRAARLSDRLFAALVQRMFRGMPNAALRHGRALGARILPGELR